MSHLPPTILFEDRLRGAARLYGEARGWITAGTIDEVIPALTAAQRALGAGHHIAGYISYEAGYAFEPRIGHLLPVSEKGQLPLLQLGIFPPPELLADAACTSWLGKTLNQGHRVSSPLPTLEETAYCQATEHILAYIRAGDIYQANFTFPLEARLTGSPLSLYAALRSAQPVAHGAFFSFEQASLLSVSPELFIRREGDRLHARPMKGTAKRNLDDPAADRGIASALRADPKERAENLMIVDLLRNDLSRVCVPGTVRVPHLFNVETYPSLHTMTSDVVGTLSEGVEFPQIVAALFPCGSVTGAPKIRAQEIIAELERNPRGAYTGSMGWIEPGGDFEFNVAIRTATVHADGRLIYPVGSGVVADSVPSREYDECLLKARVLTDEAEPFDLIETFVWSQETGFAYRERHLARLAASARFFHFEFDRKRVLNALEQAVTPCAVPQRVRLTLSVSGELAVTTAALPSEPLKEVRYIMSGTHTDAANPYRRHKTTRRALYDTALASAKASHNADEVLFLNQRDELTEGTWTNLFLEMGGELVTPPVSSGLLPGCLRADLLETGRARESVLTLEDLARADAVYFGNSVRGLMRGRPINSITKRETAAE